MRGLLLLAALVLCAGCSKPKAKDTAPAPAEVATKPQPAPKTAAPPKLKPANKDEPNWLTDPRFKKDAAKTEPDPAAEPPKGPSATGKQPWGITPPAGGWQGRAPDAQPNPMPAPAPQGNLPPAAGASQANPVVPAAAQQAVAPADMRDLQVFIHDASLAAGKMPAPGVIYAALVAARSPAAERVRSGAILLTGATRREGVWAYETRALTQGGLVVSQNGVETLSAAELKERLVR
jgi:hypothetical protein